MATHCHNNDSKRERKNQNSPGKEMSSHETPLSISSTNNDLLVWLRGLALHPRNAETWTRSDQKLLDQMLHVRKFLLLSNAEHHLNKRTLEQFQSDGEASTASRPSSEKSSEPNIQKKGRKLMFSVSCSPSDSSSRQIVDVSNPSSHKGKVAQDTSPYNSVNAVASGSDRSSCKQKFLELLFTEDKDVPRPVIPVGPGFQAELPDWIALTKKGKFYGSPGDSKTLRLLGTDVWPTYSPRKKTVNKEIGKGRPDSCSCASPGSTNCIRQHTKEARELLQTELGPAFYTWKFDQMGEVVSKSWTAKEEQRFESLVKKNPLSSTEGFWKLASKAFPTKTKMTLVSYYYNVFLIKRMRSLTISSADQVESDDDHSGDFFAG